MMITTEDIFAHVREWSINRLEDENLTEEDAKSIFAEFYEWIDIETSELEIISLERET